MLPAAHQCGTGGAVDVTRQGHRIGGCRGQKTHTGRGVGLGELRAGGSHAGGMGEEVLVHLLQVSGSMWESTS
jgi:hypothetical protein